MNKKQQAAALSLQKALERCSNAGLMGGVYDKKFVVWPDKLEPHPHETSDFFGHVEEHGMALETTMDLDGGSGV